MAMPEHIEQSHQGCTKLRCSYFYKTLFGGGGGLNVDNFHILKILLVLVKKSSS